MRRTWPAGLQLMLALTCILAFASPVTAQVQVALASVAEAVSIDGIFVDEAVSFENDEVEYEAALMPSFATGGQVVSTREKIGRRLVMIQPQDEVWLVSARDFLCPCDCSQLQCCRLVCGCWQPSDLSQLATAHQEDRSRVTLVYVHGNRTNLEYAKSRGLQAYDNLFASDRTISRPPVRLVLFAWKSESQYRGMIKDFYAKSDRSCHLAPVFASFLNQFQDRNLVVSGFSLGGQVVIGGVSQACLSGDKPGRYEVAMISPAINGAFACDGLDRVPSISEIKQTTVFVNRNDTAIAIANRLTRSRYPGAKITVEDIACLAAEPGINPIRIVDMTCDVTCKHSVVNYTADSGALRAEMAEIVQRMFSTIQR